MLTARHTCDTLAKDFVTARLRHELPKSYNWDLALQVFSQYHPEKAEALRWRSSGNTVADRANAERPSFRVTCARADERNNDSRHGFTSMDASMQFGLGLAEHVGWRADLKDPMIDVLLHITADDVLVGIKLTEESLHRRNIVALGRTPLIATICFALAHLARIQPGEVVIDPMCGGLSVPLEAALNWGSAFYLGGEIHFQGVENSGTNLRHVNKETGRSQPVDVLRWDATNLPLRAATVDVVLCDLPFGKKVGSQAGNQTLYPRVLNEMARVTRKGTSRAVLLTTDKSAIKTVFFFFFFSSSSWILLDLLIFPST